MYPKLDRNFIFFFSFCNIILATIMITYLFLFFILDQAYFENDM